MDLNEYFNSNIFSDSDSDSDMEEAILADMGFFDAQPSQRRRSSTRTFIDRQSGDGHTRLFNDYFADSPTYGPNLFRRRFRMHRPLFLRIHEAVVGHDSYFLQKPDAIGRLGLSSLQKITAALRMLAYGCAADSVDEYIRLGESTAIEGLKRFTRAVIEVFGGEYLRRPTEQDIARLLHVAQERGFPGMLGSLDCMHWMWKNCPAAWHGMYSGHYHEPTIVLEAVASYDLWFWHASFGTPGSNNDINVLEHSGLFDSIKNGTSPQVHYSINDHEYTMGYYLADGIYPNWATLVKTISQPMGNKNKHFAKMQESARKDVERAFGVLQARFAIVRGPARFWEHSALKDIMMACIIMHNMIVEDERDAPDAFRGLDFDSIPETPTIQVEQATAAEIRHRNSEVRNTGTHQQLQFDLIEHLWTLHAEQDSF